MVTSVCKLSNISSKIYYYVQRLEASSLVIVHAAAMFYARMTQ